MDNDEIILVLDKPFLKADSSEEVYSALEIIQTEYGKKSIKIGKNYVFLLLYMYDVDENNNPKPKCTHMLFEKRRTTSLRGLFSVLFNEFIKKEPEETDVKDIPLTYILDVRNILKKSFIEEKIRLNTEIRDDAMALTGDAPPVLNEEQIIDQEYTKILDSMYNRNLITDKYKKDENTRKNIIELITGITNYYVHYGKLILNSFVYYDKESIDKDIQNTLERFQVTNLDTVRILQEVDEVFNIPENFKK